MQMLRRTIGLPVFLGLLAVSFTGVNSLRAQLQSGMSLQFAALPYHVFTYEESAAGVPIKKNTHNQIWCKETSDVLPIADEVRARDDIETVLYKFDDTEPPFVEKNLYWKSFGQLYSRLFAANYEPETRYYIRSSDDLWFQCAHGLTAEKPLDPTADDLHVLCLYTETNEKNLVTLGGKILNFDQENHMVKITRPDGPGGYVMNMNHVNEEGVLAYSLARWSNVADHTVHVYERKAGLSSTPLLAVPVRDALDSDCRKTMEDHTGNAPYCGDGICSEGEDMMLCPACVPGANPELCKCRAVCDDCNHTIAPTLPPEPPAPTTCGNRKIEVGEQCDDGNRSSEDGCSSKCTIEHGFQCATTASSGYSQSNCTILVPRIEDASGQQSGTPTLNPSAILKTAHSMRWTQTETVRSVKLKSVS